MSLPVFFQAQQVGTLTETAIGLSFAYAPAWIARKSSFPVSISLPFSGITDEAATAWFWNLLPEEEQLQLLGQRLHIASTDIFGLLERLGRETAGALSIGGPENEGAYRPLPAEELGVALAALPERPLLADEPEITMSLAGAQSKMTIAQFGGEDFLPLSGAASTHILKPESKRLYASVENEAFCMMLSRKVGIDTARVEMRKAGDTRYLQVERYDRTPGRNRKVQRRHQEDAAQALGLPPTRKYETRGGASWADIIALVDAHSTRKAHDRLALLDRAIFNTAIHNTDAHAKNFSFFVTRQGIDLAPTYDLMTSLIYPRVTTNMAMEIGGSKRAAHTLKKHWIRFAEATGYAPASVAARAAALAAAVAGAAEAVEAELLGNPLASSIALREIRTHIETNARIVAANAGRDGD
ncbi:MAG: type II toxin-antitoxin system HipA family toxin [Micropepsaceae bacterium]